MAHHYYHRIDKEKISNWKKLAIFYLFRSRFLCYIYIGLNIRWKGNITNVVNNTGI